MKSSKPIGISIVRKSSIVAQLALVMVASTAFADERSVETFYHGKTITLVVGSDSGGGYDLNARSIARYIGKYIPGNPSVVVQNRPGAGSVVAANYVNSVAPADGTFIAAPQRNVPFQFLYDMTGVQFDLKRLEWIGNSTKEPGVFVAWHDTPYKTFNDILTKEMIVGGNGPATATEVNARALNSIFGAKLKIVTGYPGQSDIILAMQRGEVQGTANWAWSDIATRHSDWIRDQTVRFLVQFASQPIPGLKDVPLILDLARNSDEKAVLSLLIEDEALGRPYFVAPQVPQERIQALRAAFDATMKDPQFLAEATRTLGPIDPTSGVEMQKALAAIYSLPPELIERARTVVGVPTK
jgi:tripartite-type tricarboxylate transporter receptor subunit TctC